VASKSLAIVFLHIVSLLLTTLVFGRQSERNILPTRTMLSERKVMATRVVRSIMHVRATSSSRCEPDSHADTTVAGKNMCMIEPTGAKVNIAAYSDEVSQLTDIPIATAVPSSTALLPEPPGCSFSMRHCFLEPACPTHSFAQINYEILESLFTTPRSGMIQTQCMPSTFPNTS
jgi:hypothetical protein